MRPSKHGRDKVPEGCPLSPREFEVLERVADGMTYAETGAELGIAVSTVRSTINSAYPRLGVQSSSQAVAEMARSGWLGFTVPPGPEPEEKYPERTAPFIRAYLAEFDLWAKSIGEDARRPRDGMGLAAVGLRNAVGLVADPDALSWILRA
jgi:DNA-binding CsgD family transcriptional regulator